MPIPRWAKKWLRPWSCTSRMAPPRSSAHQALPRVAGGIQMSEKDLSGRKYPNDRDRKNSPHAPLPSRLWMTSDEIPDRGCGSDRSLHRRAHGAGRFRCHALRARAASARHAGARGAGEKCRGRFRGVGPPSPVPLQEFGPVDVVLPGRKGAWPTATRASVEAGTGTGHHGRQHAERNSMVVLPGLRAAIGKDCVWNASIPAV